MLFLGHISAHAASARPALALSANTSANPITPAFSNGVPAGNVNVSKVNVHTLLYTGHTTQVMVHYIPWFDGALDSGINVNYDNGTATYASAFCADIVSRGVDNIMVDWQGVGDITNTNWLKTHSIPKNYRTLQGSATLTYAIMLDANMMGNMASTSPTGVVLTAMAYCTTHFFGDTNYLTHGGKLVVADFGLTDPGNPNLSPPVNWSAVQAAYPNVAFVHLDDAAASNGFAIANSGGSFVWVGASSATANADISKLDTFYPSANSHSTQIAIGGVWSQFNSDPYAPWNGKIYLQGNNGAIWLSTFAKINTYFSTLKQLPFVQIVTWSDYYEATSLETGIDNALSISVSASGSLPTFVLHPSFVGAGSTDTIDHLELWSYDLGAWGAVTYSTGAAITVSVANNYYVEAVGKPFIKNSLSRAITAT